MITHSFPLDFCGAHVPQIASLKQNDRNLHALVITPVGDGIALHVDGMTARLAYAKPDKTQGLLDGEITGDGKLWFTLSEQVATQVGKVYFEAILSEPGGQATSASFILEVLPSVFDSDAAASTDDYQSIIDALDKVGGAGDKIIPIASGGTGASTAAQAVKNLGAAPANHTHASSGTVTAHNHSAADITSGTLPVARGGTGASNAASARSNIGAAAEDHTHSMSDFSGTLPISRGGTGVTSIWELATKMLRCNSIQITPSAANTPTAKNVQFSPYLEGDSSSYAFALATARSAVIGTKVLGVSVSGVSNTGCSVWLTRTNITTTDIDVLAVTCKKGVV